MNWVQAEVEIRNGGLFKKLRDRVEQDCLVWKAAFPDASQILTFNHDEYRHTFSVKRGIYGSLQIWASARLDTDRSIEIRILPEPSNNEASVEVSKLVPFLLANPIEEEAELRFKKGAIELELWQASLMMLRPILFPSL